VKPVNIGILGLGTVGCGTVSVLARNAEEITRRAGREIRVVQAAARSLKKKRDCATKGIMLTEDAQEVVANPEIDVVVELIGGYGIARELVLKAIENGKHVVTANKALIAAHGNEIFAAAQKQGVMVAFEAAVAGGIPIIKAIREGLAVSNGWRASLMVPVILFLPRCATRAVILTTYWQRRKNWVMPKPTRPSMWKVSMLHTS